MDVRFLDSVSQLLVGVSAVVILTVGDYQQRLLGLATLLDLFNRDVGGVVKRSRPVWTREHKVPENAVTRGREVLHELRAIVETDQEKIVVSVRGLDEPAQRANGSANTLFHRAGHIVNDS